MVRRGGRSEEHPIVKEPEKVSNSRPRTSGGSGSAKMNSHSSGLRSCTVFFLSVCVAIVAISLAYVVNIYLEERAEEREYLEMRLGEDGLELFNGYDRDGDGFISIAEFEPLVEKLVAGASMANEVDFSLDESEVDPAEEVLTLQAHFSPLLQETMKKADEIHSSRYSKALAGLEEWTEPNQPIAGFPASSFRAFLPDDVTPVGQPYNIITSQLNLFANTLSSNRFYPPKVKGKEVVIHRLLSMFHRRPFVHTRFGPQGAKAVIRAENSKAVDIVFRIHAEFQLNEPPNHPFWFTPGQFVGNIIISKDASHIHHFSLHVPTNKTLNVDMEWLYGTSEANNMEVDIGFMPRMELHASEPSMQVPIYGEDGSLLFNPDKPTTDPQREALTWDYAVTQEEALQAMELQFYPFKKVPYLSFEEAFQKAEAEKKLVHSILLWGALDDQSC